MIIVSLICSYVMHQHIFVRWQTVERLEEMEEERPEKVEEERLEEMEEERLEIHKWG